MRVTNVSHISTFSPTQCGIATYTEDLIHHLKTITPIRIRLVYNTEVLQPGFDNTIDIGNADTYRNAVELINNSKTEIVSLQHEFGIYGGQYGEFVVPLVEGIKKPIVTTLHTVSADMNIGKKKILECLCLLSELVVVLTEESKEILITQFRVPYTKIRVIRHGIPNVDFIYPDFTNLRKSFGVDLVFVSAGHLRPKKGYEIAIKALAKYNSYNPNFKYLILGTDQPQSTKGGNEYRHDLKNLVNELNLEDKIIWADKYLDIKELIQYILASDIGLITYTDASQGSSGILPLVIGCGRLAIATSFNYTRSIAKRIKGIRLAEINDSDSVFEKICEITQSRSEMKSCMLANYAATREWLWENTAMLYNQVFNEAFA